MPAFLSRPVRADQERPSGSSQSGHKAGNPSGLVLATPVRTVHPTRPESGTAERTPRPSRQDAALPESRPVLKCSHTGPAPPRLPKRSFGPYGSTSSRTLPGPPARSFWSLADAQTELRQLAAGNSLARERVGRRPARWLSVHGSFSLPPIRRVGELGKVPGGGFTSGLRGKCPLHHQPSPQAGITDEGVPVSPEGPFMVHAAFKVLLPQVGVGG